MGFRVFGYGYHRFVCPVPPFPIVYLPILTYAVLARRHFSAIEMLDKFER